MTVHAPDPNESSQVRSTALAAIHLFVVTVVNLAIISGCRSVDSPSKSIVISSLNESQRSNADSISKIKDTSRNLKGSIEGESGAGTTTRPLQSEDEEIALSPPQTKRSPSTQAVDKIDSNAGANTDVASQGRESKRSERALEIAQASATSLIPSNDAEKDRNLIRILSFSDNDNDSEFTSRLNFVGGDDRLTQLPSGSQDRPKSLRLKFPSEIPGAGSPTITLPVTDLDHPERKLTAINTLFPQPANPKPLDTIR